MVQYWKALYCEESSSTVYSRIYFSINILLLHNISPWTDLFCLDDMSILVNNLFPDLGNSRERGTLRTMILVTLKGSFDRLEVCMIDLSRSSTESCQVSIQDSGCREQCDNYKLLVWTQSINNSFTWSQGDVTYANLFLCLPTIITMATWPSLTCDRLHYIYFNTSSLLLLY